MSTPLSTPLPEVETTLAEKRLFSNSRGGSYHSDRIRHKQDVVTTPCKVYTITTKIAMSARMQSMHESDFV